jgi:hypothetical protein
MSMWANPCHPIAKFTKKVEMILFDGKESLAMRVVLTHLRVTFHSCTYGLRGDVATVATTLIGYDRGCCCRDDHKEKAVVIDYFLYTDA